MLERFEQSIFDPILGDYTWSFHRAPPAEGDVKGVGLIRIRQGRTTISQLYPDGISRDFSKKFKFRDLADHLGSLLQLPDYLSNVKCTLVINNAGEKVKSLGEGMKVGVSYTINPVEAYNTIIWLHNIRQVEKFSLYRQGRKFQGREKKKNVVQMNPPKKPDLSKTPEPIIDETRFLVFEAVLDDIRNTAEDAPERQEKITKLYESFPPGEEQTIFTARYRAKNNMDEKEKA